MSDCSNISRFEMSVIFFVNFTEVVLFTNMYAYIIYIYNIYLYLSALYAIFIVEKSSQLSFNAAFKGLGTPQDIEYGIPLIGDWEVSLHAPTIYLGLFSDIEGIVPIE